MNFKYIYQDSVCFNLRSIFQTQPLVLVACPMCTAQLIQSDVPPSALGREHLTSSLGPLLDPTQLYVCPNCRWWAIRESGWYIEVYGVFDYLVTGTIKNFDLSAKQPLVSLLKDRIEGSKGIDTARCEEVIAGTLRREGHPCEVYRVGSRSGFEEGRKDVYQIEDKDSWLLQVSCVNEHIKVIPIQTLSGFLLRGDEIHGLALRSESFSNLRSNSLEQNGLIRGPFCVKALDPARVLRLIEKDQPTHPPPWWKALDEESCWAELQEMSKEFASLLFLETVDWLTLRADL
jgi:hypothetical protein